MTSNNFEWPFNRVTKKCIADALFLCVAEFFVSSAYSLQLRRKSWYTYGLELINMSVLVQVVANYYGSRQRFDPVKEIHWPGGLTEAPPDIPECGFDGSGCPPDGKLCYFSLSQPYMLLKITEY